MAQWVFVEQALLNLAVLVSWSFTLALYWQWRARGRLHQFVWMIGLAFFALGVTCEAIARGQGAWSEATYKAWYFLGAMHGVTWLGQGTLLLLDKRDWVRRSLELLVVLSLITFLLVLGAPVDFSKLGFAFEPSGRAFAELRQAGWATPRAWTIPFNLYGTLWLVGGALYSSLQLWRAQRPRALGTLLIALAGLGLAGTSSLNRFGVVGLETLGRLFGVSLLFVGFALTNLEADAFAQLGVHLPRPTRAQWLGLGASMVALFALAWLAPEALRWALESPGLVLIAGLIAVMLVLVLRKAWQRSQHLRTLRNGLK